MILVTLLYRSIACALGSGEYNMWPTICVNNKNGFFRREYQYGMEDNKANKRYVSNKR